MAWLRIESNFPNHRKVLAAGQQLGRGAVGRVIGVWTIGACYAVAHLTDGLVPAIVLEDTRYDRHPREVIAAMVDQGLLHVVDGGYQLHDFNDYNPSADAVKEKRRNDLARKRRFQKESAAIPQRIANESATFPEVPNPNPNPRSDPKDADEERVRASDPAVVLAVEPTWRLPGNQRLSIFAHQKHAFCSLREGLCVPEFLHREFVGKLGGSRTEAQLVAWYPLALAPFDGQAIGEDSLRFWRNLFGTWVGTATSAPAMTGGKAKEAISAVQQMVLQREAERQRGA